MKMTTEQIDTIFRNFRDLHRRLRAAQWRGWEFDDFLASPLCRALSFHNLFLKRVWIQIGEKLPINLRPLLAIPKLPSAKADGFFARAYLRMYEATADKNWLNEARERLNALRASISPGWAGPAWGNDFDFASRGGFFPKGLPTVVWTAHISKAFLLAHRAQRLDEDAAVVRGCGDFVLHDLPRHETPRGVCIGYAPGVMNRVHNSSLLGAVALLRAWKIDGDDAKRELAQRAFDWSIDHITPEGGWRYGAEDKYRWMDNFHTGYIIDCMIEAREIAGPRIVPDEILQRSVRFWRERFFLPDATPRYFPRRTWPVDIQSAAQAIESFANLARIEPARIDDAWRVFQWTLRNMRRPDGFYRYQKRRWYNNNLVSIHWGQATMLSAMAELACAATARETSR